MLSHPVTAVPMQLLLLLLLQLESANCCDLPAALQYGKLDGEYLRQNTTRHLMRTWRTTVMGQYSPQAGQLVVAFVTPPWFRSGVGRFRIKFGACQLPGSNAPYHDVDQTTHRAPVHWLDDVALVTTVDHAQLPPRIAASDFGLCLELQTDSAGSDLIARAMSPMTTGCHVSMTNPAGANASALPYSPTGAGRNRTLFKRLADHLWRNFGLVANSASCCLVYAGNSSSVLDTNGNGDNINNSLGKNESRSAPAELVAIYYIGAVCAFSAVIACLCCVTRRGGGVCTRDRCRQLALRRDWVKHHLSSTRVPLRYELPETCGPPYRHLLTSCRSVSAGFQIALPPLLVVNAESA